MRRHLALAVVLLSAVSVLVATPAVSARSSAAPSRASAWCQGWESWQSAQRSVGELVRVKARVARSYFASSSRGRPTFLDLGRAYPSPSRLTIVIWGRNRVNFPRAPERMFRRGSTICVQGFVSRHRGAAQIEVALWDAKDRLLSF